MKKVANLPEMWREDYDSESTIQGAPFINICIRLNNYGDITKLLQMANKGDDEFHKELKKLTDERKVLK
jgi:hypothetical protein